MSDFDRVGAWIERYFSGPPPTPVLAQVRPGEISARLPVRAPEDAEPFERIMADFESIILPGITHWNSPRFFAYFATSAAPAGIAAEALCAALDVKAMLWRTSPSATELEEVVMNWLRELLGLPPQFTGIIYDTASIGGFTALAAARERLDPTIRERGLAGSPLRVYITEHTHSHIEKACIALGIGRENVVRIACDERFRMEPSDLRARIDADRAKGLRPMCVVATAGTTSMASCDPVRAIASVAREHGIWLHVDAAYAGVAAILPERAWVLDGAESADSVVVNPHKWLFVPMDCSALYVRDPELLRRTFALSAEFLRAPEENVRNYMDYGLQLGRRFRALKLWFVLRSLGASGIRERLREHIALAAEFAGWVRETPDWQVLAPHDFSLVCFRFAPEDADETQRDRLNDMLLERANASGEVFLSHTRIAGRFALRLAIGNLRTTRADVACAWRILQIAARETRQACAS